MSGTAPAAAGDASMQAAQAVQAVLARVADEGLQQVRVAWADVHGQWRGKTLMPAALPAAFRDGVGMVSTLLLKDTADRTALKVFEPGALAAFPGLGRANNVLLRPDASSFRTLPWAPGTGWLRAAPWFEDGTPVPLCPRWALQRALAELAQAGFELVCGLELEFHIYRLRPGHQPSHDPAASDWPPEPPLVDLLHPGWHLLSEAHADQVHEALALVQGVAQGLGLPLRSLEIELGPSQVEAVFDATDALTAADHMLLFANGVRQALRRAGYHATFMCRPPFAHIMSSGWHLHQSLRGLVDGRNAFVPTHDTAAFAPLQAERWLSPVGRHWLAGLLAHAQGGALCAAPSVNAYERYRPNAMAPTAICWGRDHRGALLRVLGGPGDAATRIENRGGEPMANPYLYMAAQVHAGLDGLRRGLQPPPAADALEAPGALGASAAGAQALPADLGAALAAFEADAVLQQGLGRPMASAYAAIKQHEWRRYQQADDPGTWLRREYFGRF